MQDKELLPRRRITERERERRVRASSEGGREKRGGWSSLLHAADLYAGPRHAIDTVPTDSSSVGKHMVRGVPFTVASADVGGAEPITIPSTPRAAIEHNGPDHGRRGGAALALLCACLLSTRFSNSTTAPRKSASSTNPDTISRLLSGR